MSHFYEEEILPYKPEQLYNLVADIEKYPSFVPWCSNAKIIEKNDSILLADLYINFKGITGKYTSRVILNEDEKEITVESVQGLFKYLNQAWKFIKISDNKTRIEFDIDFEVSNKFLDRILSLMFDKACKKMMLAFKERADDLYG